MRDADAMYTDALCAYEVLTGEKYNELKGIKNSYLQASLLFTKIETVAMTYGDAIKAAEIAAKLIIDGKKVDDVDIIIATHALGKNAIVFTKDAKHFKVLEKLAGIQIKVL